MKQLTLNEPPNPSDMRYVNNVLAYNRAMFDWASRVKQKLEQASRVNDTPLGQNFVLGTFTTLGTLTGTDATSNVLCTLIQAMLDRGILTTNTSIE